MAARQRGAERAIAREVLELERVVSCGCVDLWRGTELKVDSRQPFDDLHRSTALGAAIQGAGIFCRRGCWLGCAQQLKAKRQSCGASTVGQKAEMADAHEALRKDVQQEAPQELVDRQSFKLLLVVVRRIAPAKGDLAIFERD